MNRFAADLHIHTALSPCAGDEMTPPAIVEAVLNEGMNMIAICDHNTAGNVEAVQEAAGDELTVLAGIEITTVEEVHVVGLFPEAMAARAAAQEVQQTLPDATDASYRFGAQPLMNARGETIGRAAKMLGFPSAFSLFETVALIRRHGGVAVASHVDRPANSVFSQLGLFPADVRFDAIELSVAGFRARRDDEFSGLGAPLITSTDSHYLADLGACYTALEMRAPTFAELALTFQGVEGRRCRLA